MTSGFILILKLRDYFTFLHYTFQSKGKSIFLHQTSFLRDSVQRGKQVVEADFVAAGASPADFKSEESEFRQYF